MNCSYCHRQGHLFQVCCSGSGLACIQCIQIGMISSSTLCNVCSRSLGKRIMILQEQASQIAGKEEEDRGGFMYSHEMKPTHREKIGQDQKCCPIIGPNPPSYSNSQIPTLSQNSYEFFCQSKRRNTD